MYFEDRPSFVYKLKRLGFSKYNGAPSAANGWSIKVANHPPRFVHFYDNTVWGDYFIEFRVMDYGRVIEYEIVPFLFFFKRKVKRETNRYGIHSETFLEKELTENKITELIEFAKRIK